MVLLRAINYKSDGHYQRLTGDHRFEQIWILVSKIWWQYFFFEYVVRTFCFFREKTLRTCLHNIDIKFWNLTSFISYFACRPSAADSRPLTTTWESREDGWRKFAYILLRERLVPEIPKKLIRPKIDLLFFFIEVCKEDHFCVCNAYFNHQNFLVVKKTNCVEITA